MKTTNINYKGPFFSCKISNGIFFRKLFWPTVRNSCFSNRYRLLQIRCRRFCKDFETEYNNFPQRWRIGMDAEKSDFSLKIIKSILTLFQYCQLWVKGYYVMSSWLSVKKCTLNLETTLFDLFPDMNGMKNNLIFNSLVFITF